MATNASSSMRVKVDECIISRELTSDRNGNKRIQFNESQGGWIRCNQRAPQATGMETNAFSAMTVKVDEYFISREPPQATGMATNASSSMRVKVDECIISRELTSDRNGNKRIQFNESQGGWIRCTQRAPQATGMETNAFSSMKVKVDEYFVSREPPQATGMATNAFS